MTPYFQLTSLYDDELFAEFYFCGFYSRPAQTALEKQVTIWIDDLFEYAQLGDASLTFMLLGADTISYAIELNSDVRYYFLKLLDPKLEMDFQKRDLFQSGQVLNEERQRFVERAAENLDLQAVLAGRSGNNPTMQTSRDQLGGQSAVEVLHARRIFGLDAIKTVVMLLKSGNFFLGYGNLDFRILNFWFNIGNIYRKFQRRCTSCPSRRTRNCRAQSRGSPS